MATFAARPTENADPWFAARESYDQSLEAAITNNETAIGTKLPTADAPELIRDVIATALVAGTNITVTPDDAGDAITITNLITTEVIRDTMGSALVAGDNITIDVDDGADTITVNAADGGPVPHIRQHRGNWYQSWAYGLGAAPNDRNGTLALSAEKIYFFPFYIPEPMNPDRISVAVKTASAAGGVVRLGMFRFVWPDVMELIEDYSEVAVDTIGTKEVVPTIGTALERGWHWYGVFPSLAVTMQAYTPIRGLALNGAMATGSWAGFRVTGQTYGPFASSYAPGLITSGADRPVSLDISRSE